jgi:hypothetical protein
MTGNPRDDYSERTRVLSPGLWLGSFHLLLASRVHKYKYIENNNKDLELDSGQLKILIVDLQLQVIIFYIYIFNSHKTLYYLNLHILFVSDNKI